MKNSTTDLSDSRALTPFCFFISQNGAADKEMRLAAEGAIQGSAALAGQAVNPIAAQIGQATADETINQIDLNAANVDTAISVPAFTKCLIYLNRRIESGLQSEDNRRTRKGDRKAQGGQ